VVQIHSPRPLLHRREGEQESLLVRPLAALGISAGGSDAAKTPPVQIHSSRPFIPKESSTLQ
jgi:hypothetical protein